MAQNWCWLYFNYLNPVIICGPKTGIISHHYFLKKNSSKKKNIVLLNTQFNMPLQTFQGSSKSYTSNTLFWILNQKIVRFLWFSNMSRFQPPFFFQDSSESDRIFPEHHRSGGWVLPQAPRFEEAVVHRLQKSRNEGLAGIDWSFLQVSCLRELWVGVVVVEPRWLGW